MPYDLVIKNGTVVTAHTTFTTDIAISSERIAAIGQGLSGAQEIDARGLYVLPGTIDAHVHLTDPLYAPLYTPGADSFAVGTRAAAYGGTTCVVDFAAPAAGVSLIEGLDRRQEDADGQVVIDYALNLTLRDTDPARIPELHAIFDRAITSIKMFMAYEGYQLNDVTLLRAMEVVAARGGLAVLHAENFDIIKELRRRLGPGPHDYASQLSACPSVMEGEAVHRAIALAQHTGARLLIYHQSCEEGVREIRLAKARGQQVFGEVCVQYLVYTSADQESALKHGFSLSVGPPIREARHQEALWRGLADGTLDIVSTDHGPRPRQPGQPGQGMSSIETRLALVHHLGVRAGRITLNRWVEVCCTNPALIFGLPRKGQLQPGYDADIVLFDPHKTFTFSADSLHSAIDYCSYEGLTVTGYPVTTISRGAVIVQDGQFVGQPGRGRFIERIPLSQRERG
ncbi:MAG: dihydropyrimidinase [Anaerolineales bacterium]